LTTENVSPVGPSSWHDRAQGVVVVDAQRGDVVDLLDDAAKLSDPVPVGVPEGLRIDLIDDRPVE